MAKKSSKNTSKIKLYDLILFILAGGIFGLLAMTFFTGKFEILERTIPTTFSGYSLLDFEANAGFATIILLFIIFASLLVIASLIKFCCDLNIIKNKNILKISKFSVVVLSFALLVLSIVNMIVIPINCEAYALGDLISSGTYANWFTLILFTVVSLISFVCSVYLVKNK